jgi:hypothetical protein
MATKTERARAEAERAGPKKPKTRKRRRRDIPVDTSRPGVSATDRKAGLGDSAARNWSKRAGRKGGAALESSAGQPSRKSTRRSAGRIKRTTNQQVEAIRRSTSPQAQHERAAARKR